MSVQKLSRKLRRELTASPKKAAVLGLLVLVAAYFWAPLLWSRGKSSGKAVRAPASEGLPPAVSGLMPSAASAAAKPGAAGQNKEQSASRPWNLLAKWIDEDPRATPAKDVPGTRDPFFPVPKAVVEKPDTEKIEAAKAAAAAAVTPETLGLKLSSTMVGPRRRTALISGMAYEQGQTIKLTKDGQNFEFTLTEVYPRRVVLQREGRKYELTIPQPTASGRLELYGSTN